MKNLLTSLTLCAICAISANADVVKVVGTATNTQNLTPKPAFVIEYDDEIAPADGEALTKDYLYDNVKLTSGNEVFTFVPTIVENESGKAKLSFITEDLVYLPANSTVTLSLPKFKYANNDESAQTEGEEFTFEIEDYSIFDNNSISSNADKSLLIKKGNILKINNDFECKQLIVENGAGVIINKDASLTVADTAYYMAEQGDVINMGFLINKGTYTAAGSVFTKYIDWYEYAQISLPVKEESIKDITISRFEPCHDEYGYYPDYDGTYVLPFWGNKPYYNNTYSDINFTYNEPYPLSLFNYTGDFIFRSKGIINDDDYYEFDIKPAQNKINDFIQFSRVNNPYQAPIDWRSIYEDNRTNVNNVYINTNNYLNDYYAYNAFSGLTTYDGPMEYGYLQPQLTNVGLWQNAECNVKITKEDLTSYAEVTERYKDSEPKYPYIRLYCDDEYYSKGEGNRSAVAIYFIPKDEYNSIYKGNVTDTVCDVAFFPEQKKEAEYENLYPYITMKKGNADTHLFIIGAYPIEEGTTTKVDIRPLVSTNSSNRIKVGVLDYYLPNISFNVEENSENFYLSLEEESEILVDTNNGWNPYPIGDDETTLSKIYTIDFSIIPPTPPTSVNNINSSISAFSNGENITIKGMEIGDSYSIYNMSGACITTGKAKFGEQNFEISQKGIYFVQVLNDNSRFVQKIAIE